MVLGTKAKALCLLVTLLPQPNFCWSSFVVRHSATYKSLGVVCCSHYVQILFESQVPLCICVVCKAWPVLRLFQLVLLSNFCLTDNGAGSHLRSCEHCSNLGINTIHLWFCFGFDA